MTPELLLHKFGYVAVFVGTFLEGETILVMAGFFAERGHLHLPGVILTAFGGAFVGHMFWFWLGRTQGVKLLDRMPRMKKHFGRGIRIFERYGAPAIFITQWLYGLRVTCAVIIGEAITCIIWAIIIASAGYYFGRAVESVLGRAAHIEKYGLLILVLVGVGLF